MRDLSDREIKSGKTAILQKQGCVSQISNQTIFGWKLETAGSLLKSGPHPTPQHINDSIQNEFNPI